MLHSHRGRRRGGGAFQHLERLMQCMWPDEDLKVLERKLVRQAIGITNSVGEQLGPAAEDIGIRKKVHCNKGTGVEQNSKETWMSKKCPPNQVAVARGCQELHHLHLLLKVIRL